MHISFLYFQTFKLLGRCFLNINEPGSNFCQIKTGNGQVFDIWMAFIGLGSQHLQCFKVSCKNLPSLLPWPLTVVSFVQPSILVQVTIK